MEMSMGALVKRRAEPDLWIQEMPVLEYGIDDLLLRIS